MTTLVTVIYEDILSSLVRVDGKFAGRWQIFSAITNLNKRSLHELVPDISDSQTRGPQCFMVATS
jgi:hypothetical protein